MHPLVQIQELLVHIEELATADIGASDELRERIAAATRQAELDLYAAELLGSAGEIENVEDHIEGD